MLPKQALQLHLFAFSNLKADTAASNTEVCYRICLMKHLTTIEEKRKILLCFFLQVLKVGCWLAGLRCVEANKTMLTSPWKLILVVPTHFCFAFCSFESVLSSKCIQYFTQQLRNENKNYSSTFYLPFKSPLAGEISLYICWEVGNHSAIKSGNHVPVCSLSVDGVSADSGWARTTRTSSHLQKPQAHSQLASQCSSFQGAPSVGLEVTVMKGSFVPQSDVVIAPHRRECASCWGTSEEKLPERLSHLHPV